MSKGKRRDLLSCVQIGLDQAADVMDEIRLDAELYYATQEPAWQEGQAGLRYCAQVGEIRAFVTELRALKLPDAGALR